HLSVHCLEDYLDSSPESVAEQTSPTETNTAMVGELHQETQDTMGIVTRASQEHTRKEACVADWQEILNLLGSASGLQSSLANPQALLKKSLEKFTAGTLERYIGAAKHFLDFLGLSSRSVDSLDVPFLADFLHACENSLEEDLRLFLGGLLLALHGGRSLEGLDTLWVLPFLRAVQSAWIDTETAMGIPVTPDFILPVLTNLGGLPRPSSTYAQPMAYSQSLAAMRHFLTIPWQDSTKPTPVTPSESRAFTLHSLKVCLLAAGAQVRATEEARQHQGHHKSPSLQLYSRDDTILALDLQRQICLACAQGWRPSRPIARGGQPPTLEPPFHVDRSQPNPACQVSSFGEGVSRFVYSREADLEASASQQAPEVSQEPQPDHRPELITSQIPADDAEALLVERFANQTHSSSDSEDEPKEAPTSELATFSLFRNGPWGVIHACRQGDERAACGASKTSAAFAPSCPLPKFFCKRKACYRLLDAMP
ncbi:unnamed protein product, partial [Symbiodinium microadriaticum]